MTGNLKTEINEFILNAALYEEPIFDSYKTLCEMQRNQQIDYVDFERKYYQFYHGNRDLTSERPSSPVTFSDLSMDILKKVIGKADLGDCLSLRKVSRDLRRLVDSTSLFVEYIRFEFKDNYTRIELPQTLHLTYEATEKGCVVTKRDHSERYPREDKKYEDERRFHNVMLADASTFLKNPKLKIAKISVIVKRIDTFAKFVQLVMALSFRLDIRSLHVYSNKNWILPILKCLKPGRLEHMSIYTDQMSNDKLNEIAETEQWKRARKLWWGRLPEGFRMEKLLHFKEILVQSFSMTDENLVMIRDILTTSTHLESCQLDMEGFHRNDNNDPNDFNDLLATVDATKQRIHELMSQNPAYDTKTRRFSIKNSRDVFQLKYELSRASHALSIKKVSKA